MTHAQGEIIYGSRSGGAAAVRFYGVVDSSLEELVERFLRREDAERVVRDWDREEPDQAGLLHVEVTSSRRRRTSLSDSARSGRTSLREEVERACWDGQAVPQLSGWDRARSPRRSAAG